MVKWIRQERRDEAARRYLDSDLSQAEVGAEYGVHWTTIQRWVALYRATHHISMTQTGNEPPI